MRIKVENRGIRKLLISHTDLDGAAVLFLAKYFNDKLRFTTMISRDYDFEDDIEDFEYMLTFDEIIIADLSIKEPIAKLLREKGVHIIFFDHHESATWLANEKESSYDTDFCGTHLFWNNYIKRYLTDYPEIIDEFVSLVNVYDLWKQDDVDWIRAKHLNDVLYGIKNYQSKTNMEKMEPFFHLIEKKIEHLEKWTETNQEKGLIKKSEDREQEMYDKAMKNLVIRQDKKGKLFGTFALVSKISLVCSRILQEQENLDYVVCFNTWGGLSGKLSFRSKEGFNCNDLGPAKGHDCAAGGKITIDMAMRMIEDSTLVFTYNEEYDENNVETSIEKV